MDFEDFRNPRILVDLKIPDKGCIQDLKIAVHSWILNVLRGKEIQECSMNVQSATDPDTSQFQEKLALRVESISFPRIFSLIQFTSGEEVSSWLLDRRFSDVQVQSVHFEMMRLKGKQKYGLRLEEIRFSHVSNSVFSPYRSVEKIDSREGILPHLKLTILTDLNAGQTVLPTRARIITGLKWETWGQRSVVEKPLGWRCGCPECPVLSGRL